MLEILALDLGTNTGWATRSQSGAINFWEDPYAQPVDNHARLFDRFSAWLSDQIYIHEPAVLVIESVPAARFKAAQVLWGFRAAALIVGYRHEILLDELPSSNRRSPDKSDENDAKALRDRWLATREPLIREAA
jgi:hypothetical protein